MENVVTKRAESKSNYFDVITYFDIASILQKIIHENSYIKSNILTKKLNIHNHFPLRETDIIDTLKHIGKMIGLDGLIDNGGDNSLMKEKNQRHDNTENNNERNGLLGKS